MSEAKEQGRKERELLASPLWFESWKDLLLNVSMEGIQLPVSLLWQQQRPLQHLDPLLPVAQIVAGVSLSPPASAESLGGAQCTWGKKSCSGAEGNTLPLVTLPTPPRSQRGQMRQPFASFTGPLLNHFITCVHYHNRMKGLKRLTPNYYNYFIIIRKSDKVRR